MWSASSSTTTSTRVRSAAPWSIRSISRPGVATTMSTPRSNAWSCGSYDMPPATRVRLSPWIRASGASTSATCMRELAGRHQHQGPRAARGCVRTGQGGDHRQPEAERLARARLPTTEHVPAGERVGDGGGLDRERLGDATGVQGRDQGLGHTELGEATGGRQRRGRRGRHVLRRRLPAHLVGLGRRRLAATPIGAIGPLVAGAIIGASVLLARTVVRRAVAARPVVGRAIRPRAVVRRTVTARPVIRRPIRARTVVRRTVTARPVIGRPIRARTVVRRTVAARPVIRRTIRPRTVVTAAISAVAVGRAIVGGAVIGRTIAAVAVGRAIVVLVPGTVAALVARTVVAAVGARTIVAVVLTRSGAARVRTLARRDARSCAPRNRGCRRCARRNRGCRSCGPANGGCRNEGLRTGARSCGAAGGCSRGARPQTTAAWGYRRPSRSWRLWRRSSCCGRARTHPRSCRTSRSHFWPVEWAGW